MTNPFDKDWFHQVIENLPQYTWTAGADGVPDYVDPRLLTLLGVTTPTGSTAAWASRVHPEDQSVAVSGWANAVATKKQFRVEYRLRHEDDTYSWFATRACPVYDADGRMLRWVGSIEDIESEMQTRNLLREEQTRLTTMAAASPQMLYSYWSSHDGRQAKFPYVSPAFERKFGVSATELALDAASFFRLGHPEDEPAVVASVIESAINLTLWQHQWRMFAPGEGFVWVEAHSMPVRGADGTTWHGTVSDITDRKHFESKIQSLNQELEGRVEQRTRELELANRELEAFSYSVSHDLREPLRAVNGFCRALIEDYGSMLPSDAHHYVDEIRNGALRMGRLIDDLLAFSRLSRQPIQRRSIDVGRLVEECLHELSAISGKANVQVQELLPCEADAALLKQVFSNLLSNAFKYSRLRDSPQIGVSSRRDEGGHVVYSVRDNGTGFDMKYVHKLFQVFQRLHRGGDFEGTGVGLAIVQRIVVRHGGRVWVEAEPDAGATFYFTLS
jgi:PAS domain S-box-containing protein